MGRIREITDQDQRFGSTGSNVSVRDQLSLEAQTTQYARSSRTGAPIATLDNADKVWTQNQRNSRAPHSYFDYYFSGQDIQVFIDGADNRETQGEMPVMQFAFNIQQQKTPIYGYASYTYDAMMRGNRVVTGALRIATKDVHHMTNMIQEAAQARANKESGLYHLRGLTQDEENIERYWTKNIDPEIAFKNSRHIWSTHPPFNFIVVYGIQSTSIIDSNSARVAELSQRYVMGDINNEDNMLYTDINERLIEADSQSHSQRRVIESVELTGLQVEYTPDGQPCAEVYSFLARDIRLIKT